MNAMTITGITTSNINSVERMIKLRWSTPTCPLGLNNTMSQPPSNSIPPTSNNLDT
jgi:hypothetical protein